MKKLKFNYNMRLTFEYPVHDHHFTIRCIPVDDERQSIFKQNIEIYPKHISSTQIDSFGNKCIYGTAVVEHNYFSVELSGEAVIDNIRQVEVREEKAALFKYDTALTEPGEQIKNFHSKLSLSKSDNLKKAMLIMDKLYGHFGYKQGVTNISTTAESAFSQHSGVCQDYAHIFISLCRLEKIPCRYIAGMMIGEGETHAWAEIFHEGFWIPLDPTHNRKAGDTYIKISAGRDSRDCSINQGVFTGGGAQKQAVNVIVTEI
ncbi:MAG: transglutaminase family protein [Firmicutes bacterium]|nr:transglutaminase family protein [Bacillota bacterium]